MISEAGVSGQHSQRGRWERGGNLFYNLEEVVFDADESYVPNGYIAWTKWYIDGVYQTQGSYYHNMSVCFALYGSPEGDCYELDQGQTTVQIKLKVQSNYGYWDEQTITYTIKEHKGRKYFVKDHLGSVRVTIDEAGEPLGFDDYYPFGLTMPGRSSNSANPNDDYKFTGHEHDDEAGLTLDYMMARNYDPIIGRFLQIDPLADQYPGWTPYHYVHNNPLNLTDPTGMAAEDCCPSLLPIVATKAVMVKYNLDNALSEPVKIGYRGSATYSVGGTAAMQFNSLGLTLDAFSTNVIGIDVNIEYSSSDGLTGYVNIVTPDNTINQEIAMGLGPVGVSQSSSYTKTGEEATNLEMLTGSDETTKAVEGGPVKLESITNNNTGQKTVRLSSGLDFKAAFGHIFDASSRIYVEQDLK